jgi:hypothetical protein
MEIQIRTAREQTMNRRNAKDYRFDQAQGNSTLPIFFLGSFS